MLDQVPLTWRAILGIVYVTSPRYCVRYGSTTWQYGFTPPSGAVVLLPPALPAIQLFDNPVAPQPSPASAPPVAEVAHVHRHAGEDFLLDREAQAPVIRTLAEAGHEVGVVAPGEIGRAEALVGHRAAFPVGALERQIAVHDEVAVVGPRPR